MNEIGSKTLNSSKAAAEPDRREGGLAAIRRHDTKVANLSDF